MEIEVTEEMIEAGAAILLEAAEYPRGAARVLVEEIFRAMQGASQRPAGIGKDQPRVS